MQITVPVRKQADPPLSPADIFLVCAAQEFDAFLEALGPVLARLSYAFSRLVLVCEGSAGFQAQVHGWAGGFL